MNELINKQHRLKMFISETVVFSMIFAVLGMIVILTFRQILYQGADNDLRTAAYKIKTQNTLPNPANFKTLALLYNKDGEIVNFSALGDRSTPLAKIRMEKADLNEIHNIRLNDTVYFRTMLVKLATPLIDDGETTAYALLMENVTSERQSVYNFVKVMLVAFLAFTSLTIFASWRLSQRYMQPAVKAWQQQQDFVNSAAHELRTPLTIIQNKLELLLTRPNIKIKDQYDGIIMALSEIRRLNSLSADLLTLARANSNVAEINRTEIETLNFFKQVIEPYSEIAELEEKIFTTNLQADATVNLDQQRLHQLMVILLDNALKYTEAKQEIMLLTEIKNKQLIIKVSDTGRGISDFGKQHVFDRFYREDKSGSRATGGTGLGLTIAKWIVDIHHGKITVDNLRPHGTIFTVSLPINNDKKQGS